MAKTKKGLPSLKDEMSKIGRKHHGPQNVAQLRAALSVISGQTGIRMRKSRG